MRRPLMPLLAVSTLLAACEVQEVVEPQIDPSIAASAASSPRSDCRLSPLTSSTAGSVDAGDCLFDNGSVTRHQDLYLVSQGRLGMPDLSGANMLTFTTSAEFGGIHGIGKLDGQVFPDPVYGAVRFPAGAPDAWGSSFSVVGSSPTYKMYVGGWTSGDLGAYTVTTSVRPTIDTCEHGHAVFLQGAVSFSSDISNATACHGTVEFGPNIGQPLIYQGWYYKLFAGQTLNATAAGLDPEPTLVLALIPFGPGQAELDFADGEGDTDRAVSFTATQEMYVWVEVSSAPGVESAYTLTVDGP